MAPIIKTIIDRAAPGRLLGRTVTITVDKVNHKLSFAVDIPDDATNEELAYLRKTTKGYVDELRKKFPFIGADSKEEVRG